MSNFHRKRNILMILTIFVVLFLLFLPLEIRFHLEDNIRLFEGQEHSYSVKFPLDLYIKADRADILNINGSPVGNDEICLLGFKNDLSLRGVSRGNVNLELSLFKGLIPIAAHCECFAGDGVSPAVILSGLNFTKKEY